MVIGVCSLEFHLPGCRSLKEKRMFVNRLKDRLRARMNVSVAEVEHQDIWQRAGLAAVTVGSGRRIVERRLEKVVREAERQDALLLRYETEIL